MEEGGETSFSKLGLDVRPKKGRALVWPSVLNGNPNEWDDRMFHEAKDDDQRREESGKPLDSSI